MAQMGFFDLSDRYASLDARKDPLIEIDAVVPWEEFRPALERVWRKPDADRKSRAGRKPIDVGPERAGEFSRYSFVGCPQMQAKARQCMRMLFF